MRLNPYCSGQWSRTLNFMIMLQIKAVVLILIVVDNGLVHRDKNLVTSMPRLVLILIVVDNGLVLMVIHVSM